MTFFHITTRDAWEAARGDGAYRAPSLEREGFIHLSTDRQWLEVANRLFRGTTGLVLLTIREDRLQAEVRFEQADGQTYPHLYGALNLDAVVEALALPVDEQGAIGIPAELAPWRAYFE